MDMGGKAGQKKNDPLIAYMKTGFRAEFQRASTCFKVISIELI
jgi:hypothetical protein